MSKATYRLGQVQTKIKAYTSALAEFKAEEKSLKDQIKAEEKASKAGIKGKTQVKKYRKIADRRFDSCL